MQTINSLEKDIAGLKKEIGERDETIGDKEKRIYDLKKKNQVQSVQHAPLVFLLSVLTRQGNMKGFVHCMCCSVAFTEVCAQVADSASRCVSCDLSPNLVGLYTERLSDKCHCKRAVTASSHIWGDLLLEAQLIRAFCTQIIQLHLKVFSSVVVTQTAVALSALSASGAVSVGFVSQSVNQSVSSEHLQYLQLHDIMYCIV